MQPFSSAIYQNWGRKPDVSPPILLFVNRSYLEQWLTQKHLTRAEVVRRSNLNKAYVYQIFSGKKYPSRDKVIALSFGLGLSAEEAQTLLKQAGYRELYPRDPRDALLLFALGKGMSILAANELLYDHEVEVLE